MIKVDRDQGMVRKLHVCCPLGLRLRVAGAVMNPAHRLLLCMPGRLSLGSIHDLFRVVGQLCLFLIRRCADNNNDGLIAPGHGRRAKLKAEPTVFKGVAV